MLAETLRGSKVCGWIALCCVARKKEPTSCHGEFLRDAGAGLRGRGLAQGVGTPPSLLHMLVLAKRANWSASGGLHGSNY